MVLGLRSKHRRGASVKITYIVHVEELRPWPPSQSLRSVQIVLLQWENGNQDSGTFLSTAKDSKVVFNESFKLPLILYQDKKAPDKFQKNILEFSLFVPHKDKAKGQLLGTAQLNLADYGVAENTLSINVPVNLKKTSNNSVQPALIISLEPVDKDSSNSSPNVGLSKETSLDKDNEDLEITSFSDDDASSQSSRTVGSSTFDVGTSSPSQFDKNGYGYGGFDPEQKMRGRPSSTDASSDSGKHGNDNVPFSKFHQRSMTSVKKNSESPPLLRSSLSTISQQDINVKPKTTVARTFLESYPLNSDELVTNNKLKATENTQQSVEGRSWEEFAPGAMAILADNYGRNANESTPANSLYSHAAQEKELPEEDEQINDAHSQVNIEKGREVTYTGSDEQIMEEESKFSGKLSGDTTEGQVTKVSTKTEAAVPLSSSDITRLKHVKSVQRRGSFKGSGFMSDNYAVEKELDVKKRDGSQQKGEFGSVIGRKDPQAELSDSNNEWKMRVEMLEEELREAAATEVGLYSAVAEHANSANKVHTPARRLSRFYVSACKTGSQAKRASAARAAVSGLVLVSKSCGHDVPRLTFWLSNTIMLRAIVSQTAAEFTHSDRPERKSNDTRSQSTERHPHKGEDSSHLEGKRSTSIHESDDREDVSTFIIALEKLESWLFSRIVESLWWQTFTPHMQPTVANPSDVSSGSGTKKTCGRRNSLVNNEQGNFSTELWKKAFKEACEKLCPLRAGGHECGCLSVLVRLVMEQLVDRLDVAMFNAILRESAEEMPTDPLSDPICESKVLPIPAGKSSFGAGVELKNSIGNWSRWLTDLFDLEDDSTEHSDQRGDGKRPKIFKAFRLLHSLSDLMMLPFGMLSDTSIRREVCPMFGPSIIKRVLSSFIPDEFCPDPIPQNIINALETEEVSEASEELLTSFPCSACPTKYTPPSAALLTCVGEVGSQVLQSSRLSSLKKSYNSDDELDELDSSFTSIVPDSFQSSALAKLSLIVKEKGGNNVLRYQLLREIWKDDE